MSEFKRVGVLGAGLMGSGIAQVAAVAGCSVMVRDLEQSFLDRARKGIEGSTAKFVEKGKLAEADRAAALGRLRFGTELDALTGCDLIIEAVTEDLAVKNDLWKTLDAACAESVVFASNTSSLPIAAMAAVTGRADRFLGLHFFSPVPMMPLVEVIRTVATSDETFDRALRFVRSLGKEAVAARDTPGFIVNRLLVPYMIDAAREAARGLASIPDIDQAMKLGCGHPMGPLTLLDMIGLDTALRVAEVMYQEFREPQFAPPPVLRRMVTMGYLGRKSGRGFYDYSVTPPRPMAVA